MGSLREHDRVRRGGQARACADGQIEALLRAICQVLARGPAELGVEEPAVPDAETQSILRAADGLDLPEAVVCRAWLEAGTGPIDGRQADALVGLNPARLWFPVRALVHRLLAHSGRRKGLADLLASHASPTVVDADAWLQAAATSDAVRDAIARLVPLEAGILSAESATAWEALLRAEFSLADSGPSREQDAVFIRVAALADAPLPSGYAGREQLRLAARAAAAYTRSELARGRDAGEALASSAARNLPAWERSYLKGLGLLALGQRAPAATELAAALAKNPNQDSVRTALAFALAERSVEAALDALEHPEPAWALLVSRALLLARLGRYPEAQASLDRADGEAGLGTGARRMMWARGQRQLRLREAALRVALAEHSAAWQAAERAAEIVWGGGKRKALLETRRLYAVHRQLRALGPSDAWQRTRLEQRLERGRHELGSVPLVGDALFFRAQVVADHDPDRAKRDLQTLLRQQAWLEGERRVGGARIVAAGDLLLRLGDAPAAIRAYQAADRASTEAIGERRAIAVVLAGASTTPDPSAVTGAMATAGPWPSLVAAAACLVQGQADRARAALERTESLGAPPALAQAVRVLLGCLARERTCAPADLAGVGLPRDTLSALCLLFGAGSQVDRAKAFVNEHGHAWLEKLPGDPECAAHGLVSSLCEEGAWTEALRVADGLARAVQPWARELGALVRIAHALELAASGKLAEGERELSAIRVTG